MTGEVKTPASNVFKQLLKEFAFPFIIAACWALFNFFDSANEKRSVQSSIAIFSGAFFFSSWILSQWFRVRKQLKVDRGLSAIEDAVNRSLDNIEAKTNEVINNVTGGVGACYLAPMLPLLNGHLRVIVRNFRQYPLYEVQVHIVDLDLFEEAVRRNEVLTVHDRSQRVVNVGSLAPSTIQFTQELLVLRDGDSKGYNIFFNARNGMTTQLLRYKKINDEWKFATKLMRGDEVLFKSIDDAYPVLTTGDVDWNG